MSHSSQRYANWVSAVCNPNTLQIPFLTFNWQQNNGSFGAISTTWTLIGNTWECPQQPFTLDGSSILCWMPHRNVLFTWQNLSWNMLRNMATHVILPTFLSIAWSTTSSNFSNYLWFYTILSVFTNFQYCFLELYMAYIPHWCLCVSIQFASQGTKLGYEGHLDGCFHYECLLDGGDIVGGWCSSMADLWMSVYSIWHQDSVSGDNNLGSGYYHAVGLRAKRCAAHRIGWSGSQSQYVSLEQSSTSPLQYSPTSGEQSSWHSQFITCSMFLYLCHHDYEYWDLPTATPVLLSFIFLPSKETTHSVTFSSSITLNTPELLSCFTLTHLRLLFTIFASSSYSHWLSHTYSLLRHLIHIDSAMLTPCFVISFTLTHLRLVSAPLCTI